MLIIPPTGWLRASVRAIDESNPRHRSWLPHRNYLSTDVAYLQDETPVDLLVEIWPTAVIVQPGGKIVFEVSNALLQVRHGERKANPAFLQVATADTQGGGIFNHCDPNDR
jgi:hypothetical protein